MKLFKCAVWLCAGSFFLCGSGGAVFFEPGYGARGGGKAGAFVAGAEGAASARWNPAALANVYAREFLFEHQAVFAGLPDVDLHYNFASFVYPIYGKLNLGFSYSSFSGDDIYRAGDFKLSAARDFFQSGLYPMRLAGGFNLSYLSHEFVYKKGLPDDLKDPFWSEQGSGAKAFGADAGILFEPLWEVPVGISVKNIISADLGIKEQERVPVEIRAGVGYRFTSIGPFEFLLPEVAFFYTDRNMGTVSDKMNFAVGVEGWLSLNKTGFRAGVNRDSFSLGGSWGRDFEPGRIRFDYAATLAFSSLRDHYGHHRLSTSISF
ncbi:MAG: hypothetical protein ACQESB_06040 [Elusimicrobiota bacterium]